MSRKIEKIDKYYNNFLFFVKMQAMNYISYEFPYLLFLFFPAVYCLYKCKEHIKPKIFVHLHFLSGKKSFKNLEWIIKIIILALLLFALSSPVTIDKKNPLNRDGKDIVLAIDASGSMNASGFMKKDDVFDFESKDVNKERLSRFEITKLIATNFIKKRTGDNVGVVVYGDFAFIASPITYEKEIVSDMLGYLTEGMAGQNTAIGDAIHMSIRAFRYSKAKTKIIILLTDGEHNSGEMSPKDATALAKKEGMKIYTIGIGNKGEADEALLKEMAKESGGEFFSATSATELQKVYSKIDELESSKIKNRDYALKNYYYWTLLLVAFGLLLFLLSREVRR